MIRVAIIEDEKKMSDTLMLYLDKMMENVAGMKFSISVYSDTTPFLDEFHSQFDLLLMDIELPTMSGMDAAKKIREKDSQVTIIFITYMAKFAIKGYEVDAYDFVVKPVSYLPFSVKIQQAVANIKKNHTDFVVIKTKTGVQKVFVSSILYLEVNGHNLQIITQDGVVESYNSLSNMKKLLEPYYFLQCSISYLVNPKYITKIIDSTVYIDNFTVKISRPKKKEFMSKLTNYLGNIGGENT